MNTVADSSHFKVPIVLFFVLGVILTVAARFYGLTDYGLWMDEVFSVRIAGLDWISLFQQVVGDAVHPPLFYIILKLWIIIGGESLLWIKLLPVLFAVASIGPMYLLCRELGLRFAEFSLALIFISLNAFLIYYAQELRMYGLLLFLSLASMWLFVRFLRDESGSKLSPILLFAANVLLVYTHYFGWFTIAAECVFSLIYYRAKSKFVLLQTVAVALFFLPWAMFVTSAMAAKGGIGQNLGWIDKPGLSALPQFVAEFHGNLPFKRTTGIGFLIFGLPVFGWLLQTYKNRDREDAKLFGFLALFSTLPVVAAFVVSQITSTSIWVDRYLIAAGIPYILLLAVCVLRIRNATIRIFFVTLMIAWSLGVGIWNISHGRSRVDWQELSGKISESENQPRVFVLEEWAAMPLHHSLSESAKAEANVQKVKTIDEIGEKDFWLSYRQTTWSEPLTAADKLRQLNCEIDTEFADMLGNETVHLIHANCPR